MRGPTQDRGWIGRLVGRWIVERTVRERFRRVYWRFGPDAGGLPATRPLVFAANHHGWHDGFLMYLLVKRLGVVCVDWVEEYDAFPLFRFIGALPFSAGETALRAATIRRTIRLMREQKISLVLFPEAVLHPPPEVRPLGKAIELVVEKVPEAKVLPVAIFYDMSIHERPEAWLSVEAPLEPGPALADRLRTALVDSLTCLRRDARAYPDSFEVLIRGRDDANERWDLRRVRRKS